MQSVISVRPRDNVPAFDIVAHHELEPLDIPFCIHLDRRTHRRFMPITTASGMSIGTSSPETCHPISKPDSWVGSIEIPQVARFRPS